MKKTVLFILISIMVCACLIFTGCQTKSVKISFSAEGFTGSEEVINGKTYCLIKDAQGNIAAAIVNTHTEDKFNVINGTTFDVYLSYKYDFDTIKFSINGTSIEKNSLIHYAKLSDIDNVKSWQHFYISISNIWEPSSIEMKGFENFVVTGKTWEFMYSETVTDGASVFEVLASQYAENYIGESEYTLTNKPLLILYNSDGTAKVCEADSFTTEKEITGTFTKTGNTYTFTSSEFDFDTTYLNDGRLAFINGNKSSYFNVKLN